jgi:ribosomal protein S18 acetylase RimI-like enzyme
MAAEQPVSVRPFTPSDFDGVVAIMPPEWRFDGCSEEELRAQATMDFAGVLVGANLRLVAERDGAVRGIAFARLGGLPEPDDGPLWAGRWEEGRAVLAQGSPAARRALRYEEQLGERGELLLERADPALVPPHELELFVVAPDARGLGVGSALMAAFERAVRATANPAFWLQTDTTCTWEWYEAHGYVRVAGVVLDDSYPMPGTGPSPAHVFMYRRDVPSA